MTPIEGSSDEASASDRSSRSSWTVLMADDELEAVHQRVSPDETLRRLPQGLALFLQLTTFFLAAGRRVCGACRVGSRLRSRRRRPVLTAASAGGFSHVSDSCEIEHFQEP
jgi:hypothetical protein